MSFSFSCVVADLDPSIPANTWWTQLPLPLDEVLTRVERTGVGGWPWGSVVRASGGTRQILAIPG